jgi:ABC-type transport system involved in multi-copper enzyme maturation permease subunit
MNPEGMDLPPNLFSQMGVSYFFQMFILLLALFFGSSVLNEELDNKTMVYITASPIAKPNFLIGKYLANMGVASMISLLGLWISIMISALGGSRAALSLENLAVFGGVAVLAVFAYGAFFTLLGSVMKKSGLLGIAFIFGWESIVQFFPGVTQKFTIIHYVKSLLPFGNLGKSQFLARFLEPSSTGAAISMLCILIAAFLILACFIFLKKEYVLSDHQ